MPAYGVFVSDNAGERPMKKVLIGGVNWIGDAIMSMPALQTYRERHPDFCIHLLVKPSLTALWSLHAAPNVLHALPPGRAGVRLAAESLRREALDAAFIFPNSFRSALIPWLARIPHRIGRPGHFRRLLLTDVPSAPPEHEAHQAFEYYRILSETPPEKLPEPRLIFPDALTAWANEQDQRYSAPRMAFIPGAARGPSKQWPEHSYVELGRRLHQTGRFSLLIMGSPGERELCGRIAGQIGGATFNLAGETNIPQWAALMSRCELVVANDSGGMHLAGAAGARVVALFGITDPAKTGPLGTRCRVIQKSTVRHRDVPRDCPEAREALAAIHPDEVLAQTLDWMRIA